MKKSRNLENSFVSVVLLAVIVLLVEFIVGYKEIPSYMLPAPSQVVRALVDQKPLLIKHTMTTALESVIGFIISIILAISIGRILYPFKKLKEILYPFLLISQTIPLIAIAPIILIWLGFGMIPKIVIVVLICTFPILISFLEGLEQVDSELIDLMKVMGADKKTIFMKVILRGSLPSLFAGLKISATYAVMGAVIGEWLGAENGLGIYMTRAISSFKTANLFAAIIIVVVLSIGLFKIVEGLEKYMIPSK